MTASEREQNPNYFLLRTNSSFFVYHCAPLLLWSRAHYSRFIFNTSDKLKIGCTTTFSDIIPPCALRYYFEMPAHVIPNFFYCYCFHRERDYVFGTHLSVFPSAPHICWIHVEISIIQTKDLTAARKTSKLLNSTNELRTYGVPVPINSSELQ